MKRYIVLALLGATWGIVEIQIGTALHILNVPFVGAFMMFIAMFFLTIGRLATGLRGSCLLLAFVASFVKLIFAGGLALYPIMGIFISSALVELIYWKKYPSLKRNLIAGGLAIIYTLFHPFLTQGLLGGWKILQVYGKLIGAGSKLLGLSTENAATLIAFIIIFHFLFGALAGWLSYETAIGLQKRGVFLSKEFMQRVNVKPME